MKDVQRGQPAVNEPPHSVPLHPAILAALRQRPMPEPAHLRPKQEERWHIERDAVIPHVPANHRAQPFAHFRDGFVHAPLELGFHLAQLGLQPPTYRLPEHREPSASSRLAADMREAEEGEGLGLPCAAPLTAWQTRNITMPGC